MASGALNQIQERHTDALMKRTAKRPLPSGEITLGIGHPVFGALCLSLGWLCLADAYRIPFGSSPGDFYSDLVQPGLHSVKKDHRLCGTSPGP